jgi:hypothetical protein
MVNILLTGSILLIQPVPSNAVPGSHKIQLESGLPSKTHYPLFQKDLTNQANAKFLAGYLPKEVIGRVKD